MSRNVRTAITPTRGENFPDWYQSVVREGELAEMAHVRGCMVIKPWGYGIWEKIQSVLGQMIKDVGAENTYFPLLIPLAYMQKEADHVEGFAKEIAVVTHHRLEKVNGQLVAAGELTEPVVVRPTSETIIGESFASWVSSYRDLPIKINQWCNVLRWERRPRVFLRTSEFLWQEGHTAFATEDEATADARNMIHVYSDFVENWLAIPVIKGTKPPYDRFPGAVETYTIEAMMQDGKALQAGTSHYLGQNFARAMDIVFSDRDAQRKHVYTTSWGCSTRLIGALIMTHADDDGLRVPPRIAPLHVTIIPILQEKDKRQDNEVLDYAQTIYRLISLRTFSDGIPVLAKVDLRPRSAADKKWGWIKRGVPIQVEVGSRDIGNKKMTVRLRSEKPDNKREMILDDFVEKLPGFLEEIQTTYFDQAKSYMTKLIKDLDRFDDLKEFFSSDGIGFVRAPWRPSEHNDPRLDELAVTIRCVPINQASHESRCILTNERTSINAIFGRAY